MNSKIVRSEFSGDSVLIRKQHPDPRTGEEWCNFMEKRFPSCKYRQEYVKGKYQRVKRKG